MNYQIKAGILYKAEDQRKLAWIKPNLYGQERKICAPDDTLLATAGIRRLDDTDPNNEDVRSKEYVLLSADGSRYAAARPQYADGDDPAETGWPVCRMPRVDHADLRFGGADYQLRMKGLDLALHAGGLPVRTLCLLPVSGKRKRVHCGVREKTSRHGGISACNLGKAVL